jgi:hypothetical protein
MRPRLTPRRIAAGLLRRLRTYTEGIGSAAPKLLYGNSAGFAQNFGPRREHTRLRRAFTDERGILGQEPYVGRARQLKTVGALRIPATADQGLKTRVRDRVSQCFEDSALSIASPNGATRHLIDPLRSVPELAGFLTEDLRRTIAEYYGCALRVESVRVWRNHHVPGVNADVEDKFSNTFHEDNCPVSGLRVFVLLTDGVTRETGALRFHDKKVSERLVRSLEYFHRDAMLPYVRRKLVDPRTLQYFEGNIGDTCVCNTQECLHAASIPKAGTFRDMLQFEVYPAPGSYREGAELFSDVPPDREVLALANRQGIVHATHSA